METLDTSEKPCFHCDLMSFLQEAHEKGKYSKEDLFAGLTLALAEFATLNLGIDNPHLLSLYLHSHLAAALKCSLEYQAEGNEITTSNATEGRLH